MSTDKLRQAVIDLLTKTCGLPENDLYVPEDPDFDEAGDADGGYWVKVDIFIPKSDLESPEEKTNADESASSIELTLRGSDDIHDWYVIERKKHDGRIWVVPTEYGARLMCSARISDADVEGTRAEMLDIAEAIERRGKSTGGRCAVDASNPRRVRFWSPRNSCKHGSTTIEHADALAREIRSKLGK